MLCDCILKGIRSYRLELNINESKAFVGLQIIRKKLDFKSEQSCAAIPKGIVGNSGSLLVEGDSTFSFLVVVHVTLNLK